ncbi:MAG: hypothetical protein ACRCWF_09170 [Beijerinckiaceae bacterium]
MITEASQGFFRVVIGCYSHRERLWAARGELLANGLNDSQICSFGSHSALIVEGDTLSNGTTGEERNYRGLSYEIRLVRDLTIHVSSAALFDRLWPSPDPDAGTLAHWMTTTQSGILWSKLQQDCPFLMVSNHTAQQQVMCSQILLLHSPTVVQAFNFAV